MKGQKYKFKNKKSYSFNQSGSTRDRGSQAERLALFFLERKGFQLQSKNYYSRFGEIDLIVSKKKQIFFVEIKSKYGFDGHHPLEAVDLRKQRKIIKTSYIYLNDYPEYNLHEKYFSVISIILDDQLIELEWIPEAYGLESGF